MVGRAPSPVLRRELENLDKDADSRKSAMRALKSYVKDLDLKTIPIFLAQLSETEEIGSSSGEFRISLYEVLARVHGVKIVPMIDNILQSIVQSLASSAGSFPLQQACSKVISAIARYGIDPTTPEDKKRHIIHSLCKPLSDSLSSSEECLSSGAALCLKALVDSDNWRFASDEMVNKVCQNVAVALEGNLTQTNSHMGLVMALAKRNPLIVDAYARLLIQSGLRILDAGAELLEGNSQKRFAAIQMVSFLMKCLDPRSVFSEVEIVIEEMEKCQSDKMAYIQGAAFEALQTAKKVAIDKNQRHVRSPASLTASNFSRGHDMEGDNFCGDEDHSPTSFSPESRTLDFFPGYESLAESPISTNKPLLNSNYERRSVNRKLWSQENGGVDVSLKNGLSSEERQRNGLLKHSVNHELSNGDECFTEEFSGFMPRNQLNRASRSTTTSPRRTATHDDMSTKIFQTPRKLFDSFQDPDDNNSDCSQRQNRRTRSLSGNIEWSPASNSRNNRNGSADHVNYDDGEDNESLYDDVPCEGGPELVSSTDNLHGDADMQMPPEVVPENRLRKVKSKFLCGLSFVLVAMATPLLWISSHEEGHYLVPT